MKTILILIGGALVVFGVTSYLITKEPSATGVVIPEEVRSMPTFIWQYEGSEKDGIPYTSISLMAAYDQGTPEMKYVDTVEGGCNAYENADADVYERSTMIICYYAGLGRYFKVVADEQGYAVHRRIFEEASPDYNPPLQPYETIIRF